MCRSDLCEGECMGCSPGDEPLTLTRCHNCGLPQLYEGMWYVDQIFTLKQIGEEACKKKRRIYVVFMDLEKVYGRINYGRC